MFSPHSTPTSCPHLLQRLCHISNRHATAPTTSRGHLTANQAARATPACTGFCLVRSGRGRIRQNHVTRRVLGGRACRATEEPRQGTAGRPAYPPTCRPAHQPSMAMTEGLNSAGPPVAGRSRAAFPSKSHDGSHDGSTHAVRRTPVFGFRRGAADSRRDAIHESLSDELD